jgi:hypothetical protein
MMNTPTEKLLSEVNEFLAVTGMSPSYFGKVASGNSELVKRLENGKRVWPETAEKVREFMAEKLQARAEKQA